MFGITGNPLGITGNGKWPQNWASDASGNLIWWRCECGAPNDYEKERRLTCIKCGTKIPDDLRPISAPKK